MANNDNYDFGKVLNDFFVNKGYSEVTTKEVKTEEAKKETNEYVRPSYDDKKTVDVEKYNELMKDYRNLSERSKRQLEESKDAAVCEFVTSIANSLNDLEKCEDDAAKLIYGNIIRELKKYGIVPLDIKVGCEFDPEFMHAVSLAGDVSNGGVDDTCIVSAIYSRGFLYEPDMKVLKPTMVGVMKGVE